MAATRQTFRWVKNIYGSGALVRRYPEGDSETYKIGAILLYDASENGVVEGARSSGKPDDDLQMLGLALKDAVNNSVNNPVDVLIPRPGDVFESSLGSGEDSVVAPDLDNIGDLYGVVKLSSTGGAGVEYVVDENDTSNPYVKVIDVQPQDAERRSFPGSAMSAGDRVLFVFLSTVLDSNGSIA